jgi:dolichol-phosphate mannosyltransferase
MRTSEPTLTLDRGGAAPELSLVIPCYNEEKCLELTVPPLAEEFRRAGVDLQLVLVENGSTDGTSEAIDRLIARGFPITKGVVPVNQGQGLGFLTGYRLCRGRYVGHLCADGQVAPASVLTVYRTLRASSGPALAKARRRFRQDSWARKVISIIYNAGMQAVFPGMPSIDINGNPKILPADVLRLMNLASRDWFVEAEMMLKARHLELMVFEIDVPGFARQQGRSHVRLTTVLEFVRNIVSYRLGGLCRAWRKQVAPAMLHPTQDSPDGARSIREVNTVP